MTPGEISPVLHDAERLRQQYLVARGTLSLDDLIELAARKTANVELLGQHAYKFTFDDGSILKVTPTQAIALEGEPLAAPRILQVHVLDEQGEIVSRWWTTAPYKHIVTQLQPLEIYDSLEELRAAKALQD
jgi:hypothetical protein